MIWSDCEAVVKRFRRVLAGHTIKPNSSHADLWLEIQQCAVHGPTTYSITKVAAHQSLEGDHGVFHEWCFRHNALADRCAVAANMRRPGSFWEMHARHVQAADFIHAINRLVQSIQLAISKQAVSADTPDRYQQEPQICELACPASHWVQLPAPVLPAQAVRWYGDEIVRRLVSWFWFTLSNSQQPVIWVSHFQLYIDYMFSTGCPGPIRIGNGKWIAGDMVSHLSLRGHGFKQRTRWWTKAFKETLRHQGIQLQMEYGKPRSQCILMHTGVIALPWEQSRLDAIDKWLLACSPGTFRRQSRSLDSIPFAVRNDEFPQVPVTTMG